MGAKTYLHGAHSSPGFIFFGIPIHPLLFVVWVILYIQLYPAVPQILRSIGRDPQPLLTLAIFVIVLLLSTSWNSGYVISPWNSGYMDTLTFIAFGSIMKGFLFLAFLAGICDGNEAALEMLNWTFFGTASGADFTLLTFAALAICLLYTYTADFGFALTLATCFAAAFCAWTVISPASPSNKSSSSQRHKNSYSALSTGTNKAPAQSSATEKSLSSNAHEYQHDLTIRIATLEHTMIAEIDKVRAEAKQNEKVMKKRLKDMTDYCAEVKNVSVRDRIEATKKLITMDQTVKDLVKQKKEMLQKMKVCGLEMVKATIKVDGFKRHKCGESIQDVERKKIVDERIKEVATKSALIEQKAGFFQAGLKKALERLAELEKKSSELPETLTAELQTQTKTVFEDLEYKVNALKFKCIMLQGEMDRVKNRMVVRDDVVVKQKNKKVKGKKVEADAEIMEGGEQKDEKVGEGAEQDAKQDVKQDIKQDVGQTVELSAERGTEQTEQPTIQLTVQPTVQQTEGQKVQQQVQQEVQQSVGQTQEQEQALGGEDTMERIED